MPTDTYDYKPYRIHLFDRAGTMVCSQVIHGYEDRLHEERVLFVRTLTDDDRALAERRNAAYDAQPDGELRCEWEPA